MHTKILSAIALHVLFLYDNNVNAYMKPSAVALNVLAVFYQRILKKPSISVACTVIIIIRYSASPINNYIRTNPPVTQKERSMVSDSTKQKRPASHAAFCVYLTYSPRVQVLDNNNIQSSPPHFE